MRRMLCATKGVIAVRRVSAFPRSETRHRRVTPRARSPSPNHRPSYLLVHFPQIASAMSTNTEDVLKQAEQAAKSDPKRAEQIYNDILGTCLQLAWPGISDCVDRQASEQRCYDSRDCRDSATPGDSPRQAWRALPGPAVRRSKERRDCKTTDEPTTATLKV